MFCPSFNKGSVLKQHMLEALRDYPYTVLDVGYSAYGDGVISGFEVTPKDGDKFEISPGILKLNEKIYVSSQSITIDQLNEKHYVYLTIQKQDNPDGKDIIININQGLKPVESELEIFRYTKNAEMFEYKDIGELFSKPMNRINQSYCKYSVIGGSTLHPYYLKLFGEAIIDNTNATAYDVAFAYQCLNGIRNINVVNHYFKGSSSNTEILNEMKAILDRLKKNSTVEKRHTEKIEKPKKMLIS